MKRFRKILLLLLLISSSLYFIVACSEDNGDNPAIPIVEEKVTVLIKAESGGTVTLNSGISLYIPPLALDQDTNISLGSVDITQFDGDANILGGVNNLHIVGAVLEPEGTVLAVPAVVRFPLPEWWVNDEALDWYGGPGNDPLEALPIGDTVTVTGTTGAYVAEVELSHFSFGLISRNCHSGTFRNVTEKFIARGCTEEQITDLVEFFYEDITIDATNANAIGATDMQGFLDSYFDNRTPYDFGEEISEPTINELIEFVKEGREVVIGFNTSDTWPDRNTSRNNLYSNLPHTASLELDENGMVQMRHTIAYSPSTKDDLERYSSLLSPVNMGSTLSYTYPLKDIEEYRRLRNGQAFKDYVLQEYSGTMADEDFTISVNKYNSVNIYVERAAGITQNPCADIHVKVFSDQTCVEEGTSVSLGSTVVGGDEESYIYHWDLGDGTVHEGFYPSWEHTYTSNGSKVVKLSVRDRYTSSEVETTSFQVGGCSDTGTTNIQVNIPGYTPPFITALSGAILGSIDASQNIYPSIFATNDQDITVTDIFTIMLTNTLPGAGSYNISNLDIDEGGLATVRFTTLQILDQDSLRPVVFQSISGTVTLQEYGKTYGEQLKGSFNVILEGEQNICTDSGCTTTVKNVIRGSMTGIFEGVIQQY